jgi:hypothetical protein
MLNAERLRLAVKNTLQLALNLALNLSFPNKLNA